MEHSFSEAAKYSVRMDQLFESVLAERVVDPDEYNRAIEDLTEVHGTLPPMDDRKLSGITKGERFWCYSTASGHLDAPIKER